MSLAIADVNVQRTWVEKIVTKVLKRTQEKVTRTCRVPVRIGVRITFTDGTLVSYNFKHRTWKVASPFSDGTRGGLSEKKFSREYGGAFHSLCLSGRALALSDEQRDA